MFTCPDPGLLGCLCVYIKRLLRQFNFAVQYGKIITKLGYEARFQDFKVQNIVGSTDVKFPIRLEGLAYGHAIFASVSPSSALMRLLLRMVLSGLLLIAVVAGPMCYRRHDTALPSC